MVYYCDNKRTEDFLLFRDENKFFAWLCKILKPEYNYLEERYDRENDEERSWFDLTITEQEWLNDVWERNCETGGGDYEVREFYTKSKCPECISFDTDYRFYDEDGKELLEENGDDLSDNSESSTTITF